METAANTYTVGTSNAGTIHRSARPAPYQAECMYGSWNRGRIGTLRSVENGNTPAGNLCLKCFPGKVN